MECDKSLDEQIVDYEGEIEKCNQLIMECKKSYSMLTDAAEVHKIRMLEIENEKSELYLRLKVLMKKRDYISNFSNTDLEIINEMINLYSFTKGVLDPEVYCTRKGFVLNEYIMNKSNINHYPKVSGSIRFVIKPFVGNGTVVEHVYIDENTSVLDLFCVYRNMLLKFEDGQKLFQELDEKKLEINWCRGLILFI